MQPIERVQFRDDKFFNHCIEKRIEAKSALDSKANPLRFTHKCIHVGDKPIDVIEFFSSPNKNSAEPSVAFFGVNTSDDWWGSVDD